MKSLPGILIGLAAGAVIGLLLAPASGKKTRKRLNHGSESFFKSLQDQLHEGLESIKEQYNDTLESAAATSQDAVKSAKRRAKF